MILSIYKYDQFFAFYKIKIFPNHLNYTNVVLLCPNLYVSYLTLCYNMYAIYALFMTYL